ncbi:virion protein [Thalassotalea castellviae]|uniref:Virion protein n=1 Tax=Thalassotalea castellviae TaxID=3075612 RepID=A0ABU3A002_9GAMM|nr:virion protein [Thalassotalea sp. W431]MDT0603484.1 virion protein [Thalassotalea sp. W431]
MNKFNLALIGLGAFLFMTNKQLPLGIRNNNAGNLRAYNGWQEWQGAIGTNNGFIVFDTPENGLRAMARTLRTYRNIYNLSTVQEIISRWAPTNENDTQAYIQSVSSRTGFEPWEPLRMDDYPLLMAAITRHENGQQPYTNEQIQTGYERGFA